MSSPEREHFPPRPFGLCGRDSGKKKKSENAERGKSCPTLCVYSYKGEVSEEGVRRVEFSVSLSLFLHFPLLLRLCLLAPIVFPCDRCSEALFLLKHLKWFSTNKGQTYWKLFLALSLHAIFKLKKKKAKQSCSLFFAHTLICLSALLTHHHQPTFHLISQTLLWINSCQLPVQRRWPGCWLEPFPEGNARFLLL